MVKYCITLAAREEVDGDQKQQQQQQLFPH